VDLDGTLLDDKKQLPDENRNAIRQAWSEKTEICIASGRNYQSASEYLNMLGITGSVVALNGGLVSFHGREIFRTVMDPELLQAIVDVAAETGTYSYFNSKERTFVLNESPMEVENRMKKNPSYLETCKVEEPENLKQMIQTGEALITKVSFREDDMAQMEKLREKLLRLPGVSVAKSDVNYLDVFPEGQSKWSGIEKLLQFQNISAEHCVCFGDNENDREMIVHAGLGIAMGNASMDLKTQADFVTLSNEDCGVAYGIRNWVLTR